MAKKRHHLELQVTLDDIAEKLKVSKVTVSKALRGHPDISSETAEKIKKKAHQMGYYPNLLARSLSSQKSNTIGVVVPKIAHHFFASVIEGIYDTAFEHNYEIILTVSQETAERELRHIHSLLSMRVDGLIISLSEETKDLKVFQAIKRMGLPLTFMDRVPRLNGFTTVEADDRGGAFAAIQHAIEIGYRRIAHLAGYQHTNIGRERYQGFLDAMNKHNLAVKKEWVVFGGFDEEQGYRSIKQIFGSANHPEVIFTVTFPVAVGVLKAVREMGMRIPDDIDLLCFGHSGMNELISPAVSYVEQPNYQLGRMSFELTLDHIREKGSYVPKHIKLPTRFVLCGTCTEKAAVRR
ncbi:MAG: LacI family transcriptional regulator [Ignavibacteria bacterium]|nr:LacI family transcriptional regulator [Ignavibacteria bacterium]